MRRGLAIGGFSGVGKTTVARCLSELAGVPLVDLDARIEVRHGPIGRQFAIDGEPAFRARERACLLEVLAGDPAVLATGGGAWIPPEHRRALAAWGWRVTLHAPLPVIRARVAADPTVRPIWGDDVEARFEARLAAYADADLCVDTTGREPAEIAEELLSWWRSVEGSAAG